MIKKRRSLRLTSKDLKKHAPKLAEKFQAFWPEINLRIVPYDQAYQPAIGANEIGLAVLDRNWELGYLYISPKTGRHLPKDFSRFSIPYLAELLENMRLKKALNTDSDSGLYSQEYFYRRLGAALRKRRRDGATLSLSMDGESTPELIMVMMELRESADPGRDLNRLAHLLGDYLSPKAVSRLGLREIAFWVESRPEELRLAVENALDAQLSLYPSSRPVAAWARWQDLSSDEISADKEGWRQVRQIKLWEGKVRAALFHARQSRGDAAGVAFGDLLENQGQVVQILPLDRVVISLGRESGAAPGQVFLVHSPQSRPSADLEFKGEITLFETAENYSVGRVTGLKSSRRVVAGDSLRFSRLEDELVGNGRQPVSEPFLAALPAREAFLKDLGSIDQPVALMLIKLDSFEQNISVLGREETERLVNFIFEKTSALLPDTAVKTLWRPQLMAMAWPGGDQTILGPTAHRLVSELKEVGPVSAALVFDTARQEPEALVEDALKALAEAEFSGPGQVAVFGPLSLNISGDRLYEGGDISAALKEYERGLALAPDHLNLLNSLGVCHGRLGRSDQALETFAKIIELDPDNMMAHYNLGYTHLLAGRLLEAEEALIKASTLVPDNFETLFHLGKTALELGHLDQALKSLKRAGELSDSRPVVYRLLGEALLLAHDHQGALAAFKKAVKTAPNDAYALSALGALFVDLANDLEPARSLFQKSVEIDPTNSLYRQRLGRLLFTMGDFVGAEHHLVMAMEYGSRAPEVHYHLGCLAQEAGKLKEAKGHFQAALERDPAYQPALDRLNMLE